MLPTQQFSGLPSGVTGAWAANVVTISGTPTASGPFTYTITLTGGCGTITTTGTITVTPNNTVTRTSAAGTDAQTICISTPLTNITYSTTGATGATVTGLPAGVTGVWAGSVVTISGTPTLSGSFPYTVTLTGGCGTVTTTGTVTVTPNNTVTLTSPAGTDAQTLCISTPLTNITYSTTGATNATFSGLPSGVTGAWAANVVTISGTPTASGNFPYTVTLVGGCGTITATGTVTVTPNNTVTRTSAAGTDAQTICISTPLTNITYSTTGATGATVTGLPAGVTGVWAGSVVTISGTPTLSGSFPYTVTLTGGCGTVTTTGTVTVTPNNTVTLVSPAGTDAQTLCISTPVTNITYSTTGATGATVTGLPAGVSGVWAANVVTISGTPTASGPFTYTITLTGGCGTVTTTGTVTVTPNNTVSLTSPAGTDAQTLCISTPLTNITYSTTGATNATFSGLPSGVTGAWAANVVTISGTPTASGNFPYTVTLVGGCGTITATGTVTVTPNNTVTRTSAAGTDAQTICISTPLTNITYSTTGATGATVTGLPAGVTGVWAASVVTISGTPTLSGSFPYTVTLTGGCGTVTTTGTVTVTPNNTVTLTSPAGTDAQTLCISTPITNITYSTTGATGATVTGLPSGVTGAWAANVVTISGTPTASGSFPYTVTLTGGCGAITATGTVTVTPNNTVTRTSAAGTDAQTICISTPATNITYSTTGATGATVTGLPAGVTGVWAANVVTISGTPTVSGSFPYTVTLTGGCGTVTTTGTVTVTPSVSINAFATATSTRCQGAGNLTYTTTGSNTTGITYSIDPASLAGFNSINSTTGEVTYAVGWSGITTITASAAGCNGPATTTHVVTITPTVVIAPFSPVSSNRCQSAGTVTYTTTAVNNSSGIVYSLDAASLAGGNTINSATGDVTYVAGWTGITTITATAPGCVGGVAGSVTTDHVAITTSTVTIAPFAPLTSIRCQGAGSVTYNTTAVNNTSAIVYTLDAASLAGFNTINSSTGTVTYAFGWSGTTTITATAAGCVGGVAGSVTATHVVTVTPTVTINPFAPAVSNRCQGAGTVTYSTTATNNSGPIVYSLDAATAAFAGNSIVASTGVVTYAAGWVGTTTITATAPGCIGGFVGSVSTTHIVSITASPIWSSSPAARIICENGTAMFIGTGSGYTSLQWEVSTDGGGTWSTITDGATYGGTTTNQLTILNAPVSMNGYKYKLGLVAACTTTYTNAATLTVNPNPVVDFTAIDPILLCGGTPITINGNPSGGTAPYTVHQWTGDVGPLSSYNIQSPTFNSSVAGDYTLNYKVTDSKGCIANDNVVVKVEKPTASFTADVTSGCPALTVNLTNSSTGYTSLAWDFGDGNTSTAVSPSHTYNNTTTALMYYTIKLTATSIGGCTDIMTVGITVYPEVSSAFTMNNDTVCSGGATQLSSLPGAFRYYWNYGDGTQGYGANVMNHTFNNTTAAPVTYTVKLTHNFLLYLYK